jgi:hypothetical protein
LCTVNTTTTTWCHRLPRGHHHSSWIPPSSLPSTTSRSLVHKNGAWTLEHHPIWHPIMINIFSNPLLFHNLSQSAMVLVSQLHTLVLMHIPLPPYLYIPSYSHCPAHNQKSYFVCQFTTDNFGPFYLTLMVFLWRIFSPRSWFFVVIALVLSIHSVHLL